MNTGLKISLIVLLTGIWFMDAQASRDKSSPMVEPVTIYKQAHEDGPEGSKIIVKGFPTQEQKKAMVTGEMDEDTSIDFLLKNIEFISMSPTTELELMKAILANQVGLTVDSVNFNQDTGMTEMTYSFKLVDMAKCVSKYLGNFKKVATEKTLAAMNKNPGYFSWTSVEACLRCLKVIAQVKKHGPKSEAFYTAKGANKDKSICPLYGEKLPSEEAAELLKAQAQEGQTRQPAAAAK